MNKTDKQIVFDANELARQFYGSMGYHVPAGYRFDRATHPQEAGMWIMAAIAYDHIEGTNIDDALSNIEGE